MNWPQKCVGDTGVGGITVGTATGAGGTMEAGDTIITVIGAGECS